jgi:hypothetical protein
MPAAACQHINQDSPMADSASSGPPLVHPAHTYGRLTLRLVLALMLGAAAFAAWTVIANWSSITV